MNEIIQSWPWFDRFFAGILLFSFLAIPWGLASIDRKLERIIDLLIVANRQRDGDYDR
mgnify:CR=1 FL=1